jgi:hypothetical protein
MQTYQFGQCDLTPRIDDGTIKSLGSVRVNGTPLRDERYSFLPWFDTYSGGALSRMKMLGIDETDTGLSIRIAPVLTNEYPFIERRDSSGDVCVRQEPWDLEPIETSLTVRMEPAEAKVDGIAFSGFRYWYEYEHAEVPIHRLMDRQTWEVGGDIDGVHVVCRNLFDLPAKRMSVEETFSTVGLGSQFAQLLPGNLWARWSLLPAFDMQYSDAGVLLAWFDRVSCIRSVVESVEGEASIRYVDLHYFEQSNRVTTNPKTVLFAKEKLDAVDAMNLWTRVHDQEQRKTLDQFGIEKEPPSGVTMGLNVWRGINFDTTYEDSIEIAAEFEAEYLFIDSVFEHLEAYRVATLAHYDEDPPPDPVLAKAWWGNMCRTLDFEVARPLGGEEGLKRLCDRAAAKGVKLFSWMATHYDPQSYLAQKPQAEKWGHGMNGVFAAKESGRHPDTGYPGACWTVNLNAPIMEKIRDQLLGVCERTGLKGFLWDSFSNLGWWQVDYSNGTMRPQFDRMAELYAALVNAGLYIQPEAIVSFTDHSACGLFGGNVYADELLGYSYNTTIGLHYKTPKRKKGESELAMDHGGESDDHAKRILQGKEPFELLFRCFAHKRITGVPANQTPRDTWDQAAVEKIKELFRVYREQRHLMQRRTVLKNDSGVRWDNDTDRSLLFVFKPQNAPDGAIDAGTGREPENGQLQPDRIYLVPA